MPTPDEINNPLDAKFLRQDGKWVVPKLSEEQIGGVTPVTEGGTGLATYVAGDLIYASAADVLARLAFVSAAQRVLTNDGGVPTWSQVNLTTGVTGTLPATNGGTGLSTVAQGDLLYGAGVNTWAILSKNTTATRYLSNTGTTNNPAWAQVDLSNGVTGILPAANGGTGINSSGLTGIPSLAAGVWSAAAWADEASPTFTGSGSMTWTSVTTVVYRYIQVGKMMTVVFAFGPSTVGGTPAIDLRVTIPNGKTSPVTMQSTFSYLDNGTFGVGQMFVTAGAQTISFRKGPGTTWQASAGNTFVQGQITFEVS